MSVKPRSWQRRRMQVAIRGSRRNFGEADMSTSFKQLGSARRLNPARNLAPHPNGAANGLEERSVTIVFPTCPSSEGVRHGSLA